MTKSVVDVEKSSFEKVLENNLPLKNCIVIEEAQSSYSSNFEHQTINAYETLESNSIKSFYFDYIYPIYSEQKKYIFLIKNKFNEFIQDISKIEIESADFGFPFYSEKILWHLECSSFIINANNNYNLDEIFLTPIEIKMRGALVENEISFIPQKQLGKYIVDFLISYKGKEIAIECDGLSYHNRQNDAKRDNDIYAEFGISTLRFTGSEISHDINSCIDRIIEFENNSTVFKNSQLDEKYDNKQKEAIRHLIGPCVVLAPAGSGKTAVLIERIIALISLGVKPQKILAMTFTKKAKEEMYNRLFNSLGKIADKIEIKTYHSLCYQYIAKNRSLLSDSLNWKILKDVKAKYPELGNIEQNDIDNIFAKLINLEKIDENEIEIIDAYMLSLEQNNYFTFNLLLIEFLKKLTNDKEFRQEIQYKYEFVLVDESQDNNKVQQLISKIIAAPQDNIFWVGDDDQCIFTFAGSSIENITDLSNEYNNIKSVFLEYNYRCSPKIVEAATNVIVSNNSRELKVIKPDPAKDDDITAVEYQCWDTAVLEANAIADYCMNFASNTNKIAILTRNKYYVQHIINAFHEKKISFYIREDIDISTVEVVRIIHSYLCCLEGVGGKENWKVVIKHGLPYISNKEVEFILSTKNKKKAIDNIIEKLPYKKKFMGDEWRKFWPRLLSYKKVMETLSSVYDKANYLNTTLNFLDKSFSDEQKQAFQTYLSLAKSAKEIAILDKSIVGAKLNNNMREEDYNVFIFTIHSSKGKQFDSVFLVGLIEGVLPSSRAETKEAEEEERRICYVAITRAINKVFLSYAKDQGNQSRFIEESKEPKMECAECSKSIAKREEYLCEECKRYFCDVHLNICHNCGKRICNSCKEECDCGNDICSSCNSFFCDSCGQKICPDNLNECSVCGKKLCENHTNKCKECNTILCEEHTVKCDECNEHYCRNHIITCEWCGANKCDEHYTIKNCNKCGYEYCSSCIDDTTGLCKACQNIKALSSNMQNLNLIDDKNFKIKRNTEVGIAENYLIYFKKSLFGLLKKPVRLKNKLRDSINVTGIEGIAIDHCTQTEDAKVSSKFVNEEIEFEWDELETKFKEALTLNQKELKDKLLSNSKKRIEKNLEDYRFDSEMDDLISEELSRNYKIAVFDIEKKKQCDIDSISETKDDEYSYENKASSEKQKIDDIIRKRDSRIKKLIFENVVNMEVIDWLLLHPDEFIDKNKNKLPIGIRGLNKNSLKTIKSFRNISSGVDIVIDLHGYKLSQAKEIIQSFILLGRQIGVTLEIIHGYNHGTAIKDYISTDLNLENVYKLYNNVVNPGRTKLVLKK